MDNLLKDELELFAVKLTHSITSNNNGVTIDIRPKNDTLKDAETYALECVRTAAEVTINTFEADDEVLFYIQAQDADLEDNYNNVLEKSIADFYKMLTTGSEISSYIETHSVCINEDGEPELIPYEHMNPQIYDGEINYAELMTMHILSGKFSDFDILGFITGKCNLATDFDGENDLDYMIEDNIIIINKSKDLMCNLHNGSKITITAIDENIITNLKEIFKDRIIE